MPNQEQKRQQQQQRRAAQKRAPQHRGQGQAGQLPQSQAEPQLHQAQAAPPPQSQAQRHGDHPHAAASPQSHGRQRPNQAPKQESQGHAASSSPQSVAQQQPDQAQAAQNREIRLLAQQLAHCDPFIEYEFKLVPALKDLRGQGLISGHEAEEMQKLDISGEETAERELVAAVLRRLQAYISDPTKISKQVKGVRRQKRVIEYHQDMQAKYRHHERLERVRRDEAQRERRRQEKAQRESTQQEEEDKKHDKQTSLTVIRDPKFENLSSIPIMPLLREIRSLGVMPREPAEQVVLPRSKTSWYWLIEDVEARLEAFENAGAESGLANTRTMTARKLVADVRRLVEESSPGAWIIPRCVNPGVNSPFDSPLLEREMRQRRATDSEGDGLSHLVHDFQKLGLVSPEEAQRFPRPPLTDKDGWQRLVNELVLRLVLWDPDPRHTQRPIFAFLLGQLKRLAQYHDVDYIV